jgi:hypothetical protein
LGCSGSPHGARSDAKRDGMILSSYHIISYHVISYRYVNVIISYHIISYHNTAYTVYNICTAHITYTHNFLYREGHSWNMPYHSI